MVYNYVIYDGKTEILLQTNNVNCQHRGVVDALLTNSRLSISPKGWCSASVYHTYKTTALLRTRNTNTLPHYVTDILPQQHLNQIQINKSHFKYITN